MKFRVKSEEDFDANGTSLQGFIEHKYLDIIKEIGEPSEFDGDKVNAEWIIKFEDGDVGTVYDYHCSRIPLEVYEWHIGGNDVSIVKKVHDIIGGKICDY